MQLSINSLLYAIIALFMAIFSGTTGATTTLCEPEDSVYFSCKTHSGKTLSLCASKEAKPSKSLVYKFGTKKRVELKFPTKFDDSHEFFYNHYIRSKVDYISISFRAKNYRYSVFRNYDEEISQSPDFGVTIEDVSHPGKEKTISCAVVDIDRLSEAAESLRCDPESALGCTSVFRSHPSSPTAPMQ